MLLRSKPDIALTWISSLPSIELPMIGPALPRRRRVAEVLLFPGEYPALIPTPNPDTPECYTHNFVTALRLYILFLACILSGCVNIPDSYAPPVQRKPLGGTEPNPVGHFVQMGDLNATAYIVKDVADGAEAGSWRWARKRPELRFFLDNVDNLSFKVDFSIAETLLRETGPVTIAVSINGHPLDTLKYSEAGKSITKSRSRRISCAPSR